MASSRSRVCRTSSIFIPYASTGSSYFSDLRGPRNPAYIAPFPRRRRKKTSYRIISNTCMTAAGTLSRARVRMACFSGNLYMETYNSFSATQPPGVGNNTISCESVWCRAVCSPTPIQAELHLSVKEKRTCITSCATDINWV